MQKNRLINKRELQYLFIGIMCLAAVNTLDLIFGKPFWGITRFIYLGYDDNVSAWYSSMLLVIAGIVAYECWVYANKNNTQGHIALLFFAGLLFFMSADEVARVHEIVGGYFAGLVGVSLQSFAKHSSWVWVGGPFVIVVFIGFMFLLKKIFSMVPNSMFYLAIGFSLIVLGGVVLESTINFLNDGALRWLWDIEVIVEESLEMIGTLFIAYALVVWREGIHLVPSSP